MRRPAVLGLGAFVVVLAAFLVFGALPFVTKKRDQPASITSPPALEKITLTVLRPRQRACMQGLAMDAHARQARFKAGSFGKPGPRLAVSVTPGTQGAEVIPPGWADNSTLTVPVDPHGRDRLASACITNDGPAKIALYSAADRSQSRALAVVDGKGTEASPQFGFWEGKPVSIATRAPTTVDRIATFRGFLSHPWFVWIVLVLFLVGVPVAVGWLAWRGG
jgi:hypothetical protein